MYTKFTASQTEVAELFQVERKKFFTSITRHKYDPGKKPTKSEKLKPSPKKATLTEKQTEEPQPSQSTTSEIDPICHHWKTSDLKRNSDLKIFRPSPKTFPNCPHTIFYFIKEPATILFIKT